jgi:molybdopterin-guanine dinucleotide biosynthesis protein A
MTKTVAVILAGGLSTRMGGGDKWLLDLGGQRLIDRVTARIASQVDDIVLNVNGDLDRLDIGDINTISDSIDGFAGPLAGVLAGMDWAAKHGATTLISVAADTPFFPLDLVSTLRTGVEDEQQPLGMAVTYENVDKDGFSRHPTFGLWDVALADDLRAALTDGVRKVVQWTNAKGCANVPFSIDPFDPFFNVNSPDDMARAEMMIKEFSL